MVVKHCCYPLCNSDSRYIHADHMQNVFFIKFPNPKNDLIKCQVWIERLNRQDFSCENVKNYTFICSKHFVGSNGPTVENPDPVSSNYTAEQIRRFSKKGKASHGRLSIDSPLPNNNTKADNILDGNKSGQKETGLSNDGHEFPPTNPEYVQIPQYIVANQNAQIIQTFSQPDEEDLDGMFLHNLFLLQNICLEYGARGWCVQFFSDGITFKWTEQESIKKTLHINRETGKYLILVCGFPLPVDHPFFQHHPNTTHLKTTDDVTKILYHLDSWVVCQGNSEQQYVKIFLNNSIDNMYQCDVTKSLRSKNCGLLSNKRIRCSACATQRDLLRKRVARLKQGKASELVGDTYLKQAELVARCVRVDKVRKRKLFLAKRRIKELTKNYMQTSQEKFEICENIIRKHLQNERDESVKLFMQELLKALKVKQ